jgi:hypothetical protein
MTKMVKVLGPALAMLAAGCATTPAVDANGTCGEGRTPGAHSVAELQALAKVIQSGMRTAMLAGDGLTVRDFVQNLQQSSSDVQVSLYAATGEHVYAPKFPAPALDSLPAHVRDVIRSGLPTQPPKGGMSFALANEDRCKTCHPSGNIRAIMTLELAEQRPPVKPADALVPFGAIVDAAFQAMMTVGKAHAADEFMQALPKEVPGVLTASVFSRDGRPSLGDGFMEVPPEHVKRAMKPGKAFAADLPDGTLVAVPLPNSTRCLSCHKPSEMRGAIMLKLDKKLIEKDKQAETAKFLLTASVQHVMLTGLGRLSKKFLGDAAESGLFTQLTVHDPDGRLFHDMHDRPAPPAIIAEALRTGKAVVTQGTGKNDATVVLPVPNDDKCRRCHDEPGNVRAVIAVTGARSAAFAASPFTTARLP